MSLMRRGRRPDNDALASRRRLNKRLHGLAVEFVQFVVRRLVTLRDAIHDIDRIPGSIAAFLGDN